MRTELTFADVAELNGFFSGLGYVRLPGKPLYSHACHSFDDHGRPIVTFARRCFGQDETGIRVQFVEVRK